MTLKSVVQYVLANLVIGMFGLVWAGVLIAFRWMDTVSGTPPGHALFWAFAMALVVGEVIGFEVFRMGLRHLPGTLFIAVGYFYGAYYYLADAEKFRGNAPVLALAVMAAALLTYLLRDIYRTKEAAR